MNVEIHKNIFLRTHRVDDHTDDIWFIHAFGESGLSFKEAFDSSLTGQFNVFVPDLPGFGVTPCQGAPKTIQQLTRIMIGLIEDLSPSNKIYLAAHSIAGLIGTWICQHFQDKIGGYASIEGNLTEPDSYYSSLPIDYDKEEFFKKFTSSVYEKARSRVDFRRYLGSIYFADVDAMMAWGQSVKDFVQGDRPGMEFLALDCPKLYIWGDKDTPLATQKFIREHGVPNVYLEGIGHWPMIEVPGRLYDVVGSFFNASK